MYKRHILYILRLITLIVLMTSMALMVLVPSVFATVSQTYRPNGNFSVQNPPGYSVVDEAVVNDADYNWLPAPNDGSSDKTNLYNLPNHTTESGAISSVTVYVRAWKHGDVGITASGAAYQTIQINGVTYYGAGFGLAEDIPATESHTWNTNPNTLAAWTWTDIDNLVAGERLQITGSSGGLTATAYCSWVYVVVVGADPSVSTGEISNQTANTTHCFATFNGTVVNDAALDVTERGFAWGTTSNLTVTTNNTWPTTVYTSNWSEFNADFGSGAYTYTTNFTCCADYHYRAYARTSMGYMWGDEVDYTTMCPPDITTVAATYVSASTARLNAVVVDDGGQACDVRFFYSTVSGNCTNLADCDTAGGTCNTTSYNGTTPWVEDTYITGQTPYVDITGLVNGKTYYFCSQIRNDRGCRCGGQLSFTTATGINTPTNLSGIPTGTTISLLWIKGTGSTNTKIQYKTGTYPTGTGNGTTAYFNTKNSVVVSGLTPGLNYFFMAWGESGGLYSTANATLHLTTLAYTTAADTMVAPTTPSTWYQAPDYTKMSNLPWYGMVNFWADSFEIPRSTLWFLNAMLLAMAAGMLTYSYGGQKILLADGVVLVGVGLAASLGLASLYMILPFIIILLAALALGERI